MKKSKLIFTLMAVSGIINIDAGWAMMPEITKAISRTTVKKRIPSRMVQKRSLHIQQLKTKGFRPEGSIEEAKDIQWHILNLPKKVEYLDENHEIFKTPEGFQQNLEKSLCRNGREQSSSAKNPLKKK